MLEMLGATVQSLATDETWRMGSEHRRALKYVTNASYYNNLCVPDVGNTSRMPHIIIICASLMLEIRHECLIL